MEAVTDSKRPCEKPALTSFNLDSLADQLQQAGFKRYRAAQVMEWFYGKKVQNFSEMKNISSPVAEWLAENFNIFSSSLVAAHDSGDGAVKLEIALRDRQTVEAVLMEAPRRVTVCLSCQVGCPLGCAFCATGAGGFARNLASAEIIEQVLHAQSLMDDQKHISNLVFMGMGEPCLNIDAVFDAIRILNASYAFNIGARRITISTLGDPRCIESIAAYPYEVGLAISLHAGNDALRRKLIPKAPASIAETVDAGWNYFRTTGREVTYEYVLLAGVNDSPQDAARLGTLLKDRRAFVNLIPYNEVEGLPFKRPTARKTAGFQRSLVSRGVKAHVRRSLGRNVHAACGQLRLSQSPERLK